jgi:hypothetical protein
MPVFVNGVQMERLFSQPPRVHGYVSIMVSEYGGSEVNSSTKRK